MTSTLTRLWRLPLRYAIWLALPLQLVIFWAVHRGWTQYERNQTFRESKAGPLPFDLDQWRYFARHELLRSIDRTLAPDPASATGLERVELTIDRRHIGSLNANLPESGKTVYYPAELTVDGRRRRVKTRYMGDNQWHWLYPQKSWKIKSRKGDPIRDRSRFNLKNPPSITTIEDAVIAEVSADCGLLAPEIRPVMLFVNGAYSGLHLWWDLADESMLRRFRRMPGSIYSGDGARVGADGVGTLFQREQNWKKDAARNAEQKLDRTDIQALIAMINGADGPTFRAFADAHMDLRRFATFTAIDRLFGGRHHDYNHNHKLYFDPYLGRFEPIQWDFAFWMMHERKPGLDGTTNPLLSRIREQPEFELQIQQKLWELLERYPPSWVDERIHAEADRVRDALAADGFRDSRDNRGQRYLRLNNLHSAPFDMWEFERRIENKVESYGHRHRWLVRRLEESPLQLLVDLDDDDTARLVLRSGGLVGQRLSRVRVESSATTVTLLRDRDGDGTLGETDEVVATARVADGVADLDVDELLLPGLRKEPRPNQWRTLYGTFDLGPAALDYTYFVKADGGKVTSIRVEARNAVTGIAVTPSEQTELEPLAVAHSLHPWKLPPTPAPRTHELGPGVVELGESVSFGPEVTVRILPGTTLRLGPDVSLEMRGKVLAEGTADRPIRVEAADAKRPWGVFALHGMGTRGSRFAHCSWQDGSTAKIRMVLRTGMVSIIDTADLLMTDCFIGRNHQGDDALHWGYVTGGEIRDSVFRGARSDAFDIDIGLDLRIVDCRFFNSGNDSLDLMTTEAEVRGSKFLDAGDKGISVGEGSKLQLIDSRFERCVTGIEIKDSSVAHVDDATRFVACKVGVNLYRKNTRYSNGGTLVAGDIWFEGCAEGVTADKRSKVQVEKMHETPSTESNQK